AHQKGIIHRDLKPSNILVAPYDDRPVPKVIDFGLAKAMHQALTERTLHTGHETVLGTPLYMSPEQAQLNNLDVDTRSDIYSLGVLLYELLTGTTPLEKRRFKEAAWDEIRRIISDEEPPRPSTRLSSAEKLPSLAACRQLEPAGLTRLVRGDLDWIVMKALEKQRTRRYETASGFATDVQRYLSGEAVLAAPPSAAYRLRKFVRRHRPQAIAASLVLLALLAGIAGTTWGLVEARRQQRLAEDASDREATRANSEERERMRADEEKQRAIRFRDQALDALRATTGDDVEKLLGSKKGLGAGEREYLEAIVKRWQGFAKQSGTDADTRAYQAEGHFRVAALWQKLGRREDARSEYESACAGWDGLVEQFPGVPTYLQESAKSHLNLGILLAELGKTDRAQKEIRSALAMQTTLVRQHPDEVKYQKLLGSHRYNFGALLFMLGRLDKAQAEFDAARDLQKSLADKFPDEPVFRKNLARTHSNLGVLLVQLGKGAEALVEYQAACNLQKTLALQQPAVPELQVDLADTRNHLGDLFAQLGKLDQARSEHVAAYDLRKALAEQYPAVPAYQIDLAGSCCNIGNLIRAEGKPAECLDWLDQAIRILQQVHEKGSAGALAEEYLRNSHVGRAQAYDQLQKHALAVDDWSRAIQLSPPAERPSLRASRAMSQLQGGKGVEAIAEVSELARSSNWSPGEWYNFACVYSVASAKVADKKQEYAKRAIELLRRAVKAGFDDAALLKRDADLDPLRDHAEFGALVESLSKPPAPSKR
ncbi:MAG TPA: serine/threonine-protein kinase, partial [Gemmataceae bacterium]|nr:serine/threonine-protein kinase [Gemmataceae bacterium]